MEPQTTVTLSAAGGELLIEPDFADVRFPIAAADLDALYAAYRAADLDHAGFTAAGIADYGSRSIVAHAADALHEAVDESNHVLREADAPRLQQVVDAVDALVAHVPHVDVVLAFDPGIHGVAWIDPGYQQASAPIGADGRVTAHLLPGLYRVSIDVIVGDRYGDPGNLRGTTTVHPAGAVTLVHVHRAGTGLTFD